MTPILKMGAKAQKRQIIYNPQSWIHVKRKIANGSHSLLLYLSRMYCQITARGKRRDEELITDNNNFHLLNTYLVPGTLLVFKISNPT